jgi:hypothetical protein
MPKQDPSGRWISDDGLSYWDGGTWRPIAQPPQPGMVPAPAGAYYYPQAQRSRSPWTGIVVGCGLALVLLLAVGITGTVIVFNNSDFQRSFCNSWNSNSQPCPFNPYPSQPAVSTVKCDQLEHTEVHYHLGLQIENKGSAVSIPTDIGRLPGCFYWLHMHDGQPGIIHIESPANQTFTLGDFFDVWAQSKGTPEPLDSTHVSTFTLTKDQSLVVIVDRNDGSGPQRYTGNPSAMVLKAHEVITLEITPPVEDPPPAFPFSGF